MNKAVTNMAEEEAVIEEYVASVDENQSSVDGEQDDDEWVVIAWRAWLHGKRNWTALARQFNKHRETVRERVKKYSRMVSESYQNGSVDALGEYVEGLYEDLQDADALHRTSEVEVAKLGAMKHRTECRKLIASAKGVITERKGVQVAGDPKNPLRVEADIPSNGELAKYLQDSADIARSVAGLTGHAEGAGTDTPDVVGEAEPED